MHCQVPLWWNWYTRQVEGLCPSGVLVRVQSGHQIHNNPNHKRQVKLLVKGSDLCYV